MSSAAPAPDADQRPGDPFRWVVEHPGAVDAVVFGGMALIVGFLLVVSLGSDDPVWLLTVPMIAAGALGRIRPGWAALIIGTCALLHLLLGVPLILGDPMIFYALYCATAHGSPRTRRLALIAAFAGAFLEACFFAWVQRSTSSSSQGLLAFGMILVFGSIAVMGTWAIGRYQQARLDQLRMARDRAAQAEREREQRAALAVADERARIAREMHDVVAHSLSVIIAQADGGRFIASQDPTQAATVLETIGSTGRAALADMRSLLGVLRNEDESGFGPQPSLADLPELLARVRGAGLRVRDDLAGDLSDLPPSVGLSMFRLVQEALTNVLKHAGPAASASVRVHRLPGELMIDVMDDGRGHDPDSDGHGHGLTGMRERVTLHGGTLQAGPLPSGGFRVSARVPLTDAAASLPQPPAPSPYATAPSLPVAQPRSLP